MPPSITSSRKKCPVMRLPIRRPYMSGKTASTVSISPLSMRSPTCLRVSMPRTGLSNIGSVLRDEYALPLAVVIEGRRPQLAADAATLDAAERHLQVDAPARVDRKDARLDGARHPQRAADVARPQRAGEAVEGGVGEPHRLLLGVERQDGHYGPEDLLPGDLHLGRDAAQHRRLVEAAAIVEAAVQHAAAGAQARSLLDGAAHV